MGTNGASRGIRNIVFWICWPFPYFLFLSICCRLRVCCDCLRSPPPAPYQYYGNGLHSLVAGCILDRYGWWPKLSLECNAQLVEFCDLFNFGHAYDSLPLWSDNGCLRSFSLLECVIESPVPCYSFSFPLDSYFLTSILFTVHAYSLSLLVILFQSRYTYCFFAIPLPTSSPSLYLPFSHIFLSCIFPLFRLMQANGFFVIHSESHPHALLQSEKPFHWSGPLYNTSCMYSPGPTPVSKCNWVRVKVSASPLCPINLCGRDAVT